MPAYVIFMREKTRNPAEIEIYRDKVVAAREGHSIKVLARYSKMEVLEGAELLEPPRPEEAELLALLGGDGNHRLACQARVRPGPGVVRLRAVLGG